jgi:hypothetical protein
LERGDHANLFDGSKHENAHPSSGRCLRCRRCNVLRAARRRIADIFAGLCGGLDAHTHVARLRRRHRCCCFSADWALDDALSPAASIAELGVNRRIAVSPTHAGERKRLGELQPRYQGNVQITEPPTASGAAVSASHRVARNPRSTVLPSLHLPLIGPDRL